MTDTVVCVGAVVQHTDRVLLVRQSPGHPLEGRWTIPWGQVDAGESPSAAVIREIEEEGGVAAEISGLLGIQELPEPWLGMIGILFLCRHVHGEPVPDDNETDAARYFELDEIKEIDTALEPLSGWLVRRVLAGDATVLKSSVSNPFGAGISYL